MGEIFFASQEVSAVWLREMYVAIMRCVMGDIFFAAARDGENNLRGTGSKRGKGRCMPRCEVWGR